MKTIITSVIFCTACFLFGCGEDVPVSPVTAPVSLAKPATAGSDGEIPLTGYIGNQYADDVANGYEIAGTVSYTITELPWVRANVYTVDITASGELKPLSEKARHLSFSHKSSDRIILDGSKGTLKKEYALNGVGRQKTLLIDFSVSPDGLSVDQRWVGPEDRSGPVADIR